jgi:hypothetical protein
LVAHVCGEGEQTRVAMVHRVLYGSFLSTIARSYSSKQLAGCWLRSSCEMAAKQLDVRLKCIATLLGSLSGEPRNLASKMQVEAFCALTDEVGKNLSSEERAAISVVATNVVFHPGGLELVLQSLADSTAVAPRRIRRPQQNYESFTNFFANSDWKKLSEAQDSPDAALLVILNRLRRLGLRIPKEHTMKLVTSFWLFTTEENPESVSPQVRRKMMMHCQKEWKKLSATSADPIQFLETLPTTPAAFLEEAPGLYMAAYNAADGPVPSPLDSKRFREFDDGYNCRGAGMPSYTSHLQKAGAPAAAQDGGNGMEQLCKMVTMGFQQMQQNQNLFMQRMLGTSGQQSSASASGGDIGMQFFPQGAGSQPGDALGARARVPPLHQLVERQMMQAQKMGHHPTEPQEPPGAAPPQRRTDVPEHVSEAAPQRSSAVAEAGSAAPPPRSSAMTAAMATVAGSVAERAKPTPKPPKQSVVDVIAQLAKKAAAKRIRECADDAEEDGGEDGEPPVAKVLKRPSAKVQKMLVAGKPTATAAASVKMPQFSHVATRSLIEARSGVAGAGQTKTITYRAHGGAKAAEKIAIAHCKAWAKKRGLEYHA